MQKELADLQSRIARLESQDARQAAAQTKQEVAADAEKRSKLGTATPLTAGYDKGFFIKSEDGTFLLKPAAVFQFRYVANLGEDAEGDDEVDSGFELRRTRFRFSASARTTWRSTRIRTAIPSPHESSASNPRVRRSRSSWSNRMASPRTRS